MNLDELKALIRANEAKCEAILEAADGNDLTDDEQEKFNALIEEGKKANTKIDSIEALAALKASGAKPIIASPVIPQIPAIPENGDGAASAETHVYPGANQQEGMNGFTDVADFSLAVMGACNRSGGVVDPRLFADAPVNPHLEQGTEEGFMVPPQIRQQIWTLMENDNDLMAMTDMEDTSANQVQILTDETTPWGATGIQATWEAEAAQLSASRLSTKWIDIKLQKLNAFVLASEELLADAPRLNQRLTTGASRAINYVGSNAVLRGDGVGKPLGILNSGALVTVAKEDGQAEDTLVSANIAKMFSRLLSASLVNGIWLINSDVLPQLMELKIGDKPIWTSPDRGFADAPGGFLLGRPIKPVEHCSTIGDVGDILLVDLKGYYMTRKAGGLQFADSMHLFFDYNIHAFRWTFRINGRPYLSGPVVPDNGPNTKSHFVTLAERAA